MQFSGHAIEYLEYDGGDACKHNKVTPCSYPDQAQNRPINDARDPVALAQTSTIWL